LGPFVRRITLSGGSARIFWAVSKDGEKKKQRGKRTSSRVAKRDPKSHIMILMEVKEREEMLSRVQESKNEGTAFCLEEVPFTRKGKER